MKSPWCRNCVAKAGLAEGLDPDAARELAALRACHGLPLEHQAQLHRQGRGDVVGRQAADRLLPDEVGPGVADVGHANRAVAEDRGDQRRRHHLALELGDAPSHAPRAQARREHPPQERRTASMSPGAAWNSCSASSTARRLATSPCS